MGDTKYKGYDGGRVPLLERNQVPAEIAAIYDKLLEERGVVPNMFKMLGHVPSLALGIAGFLKPLLGEGALPAWYKELVAARVAFLNNCEYCVSSHSYLAKLRGASPEQVAAVGNFETGPYTEREKLGFRAADRGARLGNCNIREGEGHDRNVAGLAYKHQRSS